MGDEPRSIILHGEDGRVFCLSSVTDMGVGSAGRGVRSSMPIASICGVDEQGCLWWESMASRPLDRALSEDGAAGCWPAVCRAVGCVLYVGLTVAIRLS